MTRTYKPYGLSRRERAELYRSTAIASSHVASPQPPTCPRDGATGVTGSTKGTATTSGWWCPECSMPIRV